MRKIPLAEFHAELKAQGVPKLHLAFKCPICGTIQTPRDLIEAGAGSNFDDVEKYIGFSCIGRFTNAGPFIKDRTPPAIGCDWTLGGLFHLHKLEVINDEGKACPQFELATPREAQEHALKYRASLTETDIHKLMAMALDPEDPELVCSEVAFRETLQSLPAMGVEKP